MSPFKIYLSPPNIHDTDKEAVRKVLDSGWVAPVGRAIFELENELESLIKRKKRVLLLNSGTSALHMALRLAGVTKGDDVIVCTWTFVACANAIVYQGANPIFMDAEPSAWNLDPNLLENYLQNAQKKPKVVIVTHLYGFAAKIREIVEISRRYGVLVVEDAAEAVGTLLHNEQVGTFGDFGIFSFNGNKIVTTGGGGALICNDTYYEKGLHLATQANLGKSVFEHDEVGYNYRISNVLAALGIGQIKRLKHLVEKKRTIFNRYKSALGESMSFKDEQKEVRCNFWLTAPTGLSTKQVIYLIEYLASQKIELRRMWKPLHLQPVFSSSKYVGGGVATQLFDSGICLPSGLGLTIAQQEEVILHIKKALNTGA